MWKWLRPKACLRTDIEGRIYFTPNPPPSLHNLPYCNRCLTGMHLYRNIFEWPRTGRTFYQAIGLFDTPVIVGLTIIYAYLLAITVFVLDFVYALVDPRSQKVGDNHDIPSH